MINDLLQERTTLYVSGAMSASEREQFEVVLEFHDELRGFLADMETVSSALTLSTLRRGGPAPSAALKARIMGTLDQHSQQKTRDGFVMSGPDGLVQWVNAEFSAMCGYSLEELRGKKLGPILQGAATCKETAARMRQAVQELRPCRERILNYHKSGAQYWAEVAITPVCDEQGRPLWLVARERELSEPVAA